MCTHTQKDVIPTETRLGFVIVKIYIQYIFFKLEPLFFSHLYQSNILLFHSTNLADIFWVCNLTYLVVCYLFSFC